MNINKKKVEKTSKAALCIIIGTIAGCFTYYLFLLFHIDIFGWNLGLIFAPLVAGYVETELALKLLNESIGAISAFILFIITVVWGFIIANPTLGFNLITFGSIIVILQAALPTLINYILLVGVVSILSYFTGFFKKITDYCYYHLKSFYYKYFLKKPMIIETKVKTKYDEKTRFMEINNLEFKFITAGTALNLEIEEYLGLFVGRATVEKKTKIITDNRVEEEKDLLNKLKDGKYHALLNLYEAIRKENGNGVIDLVIEYDLVDFSKGEFQINAHGTGVKLKK